MNGDDSVENLVYLTPEEHYVAHQLLVKMYPDNISLKRAMAYMTVNSNTTKRNNKMFGWVRRQSAYAMSVTMKEYIENNGHPRGMKGKTNSIESNRKRSISMKGRPSHAKGKPNHKLSLSKKGKSAPKLITRIHDRKEMDIQNFTIWCNIQDRPDLQKERNIRRGLSQRGKIQIQEQVECPHCNKIGGSSVMKRWHFENCKKKETI
jgi:hypothetical protein